MNEHIKIMLEKLARDEEAQKKLAAVRTPEEAYAIASALHGGYTKEELIEAMMTMKGTENADLSDADLSKAAGGVNWLVITLATVEYLAI